jgi:PEP-CTERM motif
VKTTLLALITLGSLAGPAVVQASSIAGDWTGTGQVVTIGVGGNGAEEFASIVFNTPQANGDFTGTLDVTCAGHTAQQCGTGAVVSMTGSLVSGAIVFGPSQNPTAFAGTYTGGNSFDGVATSLNGDVYDWTIDRTSVPEPATLSLLGLGLAGAGFLRRRKAN